jgi:hypothetical protein
MLHEYPGNPNMGSGMERLHGLTSVTTTAAQTSTQFSPWKMQPSDSPKGELPQTRSDFDDSTWATVAQLDANQLQPSQSAIFRSSLTLSPQDCRQGKLLLTIDRIDDIGQVFVNGQQVGKTEDWSELYQFDIAKLVHPGTNSIAIIVKNEDGPGGLGNVSLQADADTPPAQLLYALPQGNDEHWFTPDYDDSTWTKVEVSPTAATLPNALLTWYRTSFALPAIERTIWCPWVLRLEASGNGFIYLNGHCLGRYWQAGPQHDFYLPECYLNVGPGQTNNLTLSLRPTDKGAVITSAQIVPLSQFAEIREVK